MGRMIDFARYPIRTCMSLHCCDRCGESITLGQRYHDGGYGRRAHVACVSAAVSLTSPAVGQTFDKPACNRWLQNVQNTGMLDWGSLAAAIDLDMGELCYLSAKRGYEHAIRDFRTGVLPMDRTKRDRVRAAFRTMRKIASEIMLDAVVENYARGREDEREAIAAYYAGLFQRAPFSVADMLSDIRRNQHRKDKP